MAALALSDLGFSAGPVSTNFSTFHQILPFIFLCISGPGSQERPYFGLSFP